MAGSALSLLERLFPAAGWLRTYERGALGSDLFAALIVTLMLIPQSLARAMLAGLLRQVGRDATPPLNDGAPA